MLLRFSPSFFFLQLVLQKWKFSQQLFHQERSNSSQILTSVLICLCLSACEIFCYYAVSRSHPLLLLLILKSTLNTAILNMFSAHYHPVM